MVTTDELRGMSDSEIGSLIDDMREQLFKLRFQKTTGQVESASGLSHVRKDIARALTILRERELTGATQTEPASAEETG